jgi:hypothetical protein
LRPSPSWSSLHSFISSFSTFLANIIVRVTIKQLIDYDWIPWRKITYTPPTRLHKLALKHGHASGFTFTCSSHCSYKASFLQQLWLKVA